VFCQSLDCLEIVFGGMGREIAEPHVVDHALAERSHGKVQNVEESDAVQRLQAWFTNPVSANRNNRHDRRDQTWHGLSIGVAKCPF